MYFFQLDLETATEFYRRAALLQLETEEERIALLMDMAHHGWPISAGYTKRSRQKYIEDLTKHSRVLEIRSKDGPEIDEEADNI